MNQPILTAAQIRAIVEAEATTQDKLAKAIGVGLRTMNRYCCEGVLVTANKRTVRDLEKLAKKHGINS